MDLVDNRPQLKRGNPAWVKGGPSPNPGGMTAVLGEVQAMLNDEHRTAENLRPVFAKMRAMAMGEVEVEHVTKDGDVVSYNPGPDQAFMRLYLEKVMPDKAGISKLDLSDAPDEVLDYLTRKAS